MSGKEKYKGEKVPKFYIWAKKLKIFKKYNKFPNLCLNINDTFDFDCMQSNNSVYVISWHFIKVISFVWSNSLVAFTIGIMTCFKGKHFWGWNFPSLVALYRC